MRTATVLGAGTMGAQIAAHLANAGVPVLLLDVTRDAAVDGLKRARALKPDPFFTPEAPTRIRTGSLDEDLAAGCRADWVIEAVVERLDVKQPLFARVEAHRGAATDRQHEHVGHPGRGAGRGPRRGVPAALSRHALLQSAALSEARSRSFRFLTPPAPSPIASRRLPTCGSARASSWRRTRRTSSRTIWACTA